VLKLLCRFNDPDQGTIRIDGQNLRELEYNTYSQFLGVVPQDTILFNDSIMFNLKYAKPDASEEEVVR